VVHTQKAGEDEETGAGVGIADVYPKVVKVRHQFPGLEEETRWQVAISNRRDDR